jgi:two-component system chemotaxis response regulator CheB
VKSNMAKKDIIVIGASAGGFEALKKIVAGLPADFAASIFVVWHMSSDVRGVLPQVLNGAGKVHAAQAYEGEPIMPNRIYVAPPDRHLLVERDRVRVTRGPKENRFRPAVDPLFRSAAYAYGSRVVGVVLTGSLDDGTAGLWMIKQRGGTAIVQDPLDAEVPSMPENALREVEVDYTVPVSKIAELLVRLSKERAANIAEVNMETDEKTAVEISIAAEESAFERNIMKFGELSPYTCPDCHGVLVSIKDGKRKRFRCHTGHGFFRRQFAGDRHGKYRRKFIQRDSRRRGKHYAAQPHRRPFRRNQSNKTCRALFSKSQRSRIARRPCASGRNVARTRQQRQFAAGSRRNERR